MTPLHPPYTGWFLFMHHLNTDRGGGWGGALSEVMDLLPAMIVLSLTQRSGSKTRSAPRFVFMIYDGGGRSSNSRYAPTSEK